MTGLVVMILLRQYFSPPQDLFGTSVVIHRSHKPYSADPHLVRRPAEQGLRSVKATADIPCLDSRHKQGRRAHGTGAVVAYHRTTLQGFPAKRFGGPADRQDLRVRRGVASGVLFVPRRRYHLPVRAHDNRAVGFISALQSHIGLMDRLLQPNGCLSFSAQNSSFSG